MLPTFSVGRVIATVVDEPLTVLIGVLSLMTILRMLTDVDERGISFNWESSVPGRPIIVITEGVVDAMLAAMTAT